MSLLIGLEEERRKRKMKYKRCEQKRNDCFACRNGKCRVLNDTHFVRGYNGRTYKCPFYKPMNAVPYSTIIALEEEPNYEQSDEDTAEVGV